MDEYKIDSHNQDIQINQNSNLSQLLKKNDEQQKDFDQSLESGLQKIFEKKKIQQMNQQILAKQMIQKKSQNNENIKYANGFQPNSPILKKKSKSELKIMLNNSNSTKVPIFSPKIQEEYSYEISQKITQSSAQTKISPKNKTQQNKNKPLYFKNTDKESFDKYTQILNILDSKSHNQQQQKTQKNQNKNQQQLISKSYRALTPYEQTSDKKTPSLRKNIKAPAKIQRIFYPKSLSPESSTQFEEKVSESFKNTNFLLKKNQNPKMCQKIDSLLK
ncbi:hypothetical protein PPERSA_13077 [Pseudocohnilembus persalinus]|uniref:Uncharacterized protein n=1 Tax=Pseudocohnilembus persalinus TaxID=266149 RepID=A0A0V0QWL3_PSEPJ|nr:hypothetical protein PPERSA_13077 [Pseudocohnilembus persalinus]|eukprot:KRX06598.1 hypothetical protein PPERSA_13077 [Pseudocohnilembus persalinus]